MNQDASPPSEISPALIDAHVHLYDCYDRAVFFDAAVRNFARAAESLGLPRDTPGVLMLTETAKDDAFQSLIDRPAIDGGRWKVTAHDDGLSLTVAAQGRGAVTLVAGRQVVTREGLEVLALGTTQSFADGQTLQDTIEKAMQAGALAVLPFGVGKWAGKRGELIDHLIHNPPPGISFILGDNAGRLGLAGTPKQFAVAAQKNIWTLPGTDPLPFAGQARQPGRFGMVLNTGFDPARPAGSIKTAIQSLDAQPTTFGRANGLIPFFGLQVAMQVRKRLRKKA